MLCLIVIMQELEYPNVALPQLGSALSILSGAVSGLAECIFTVMKWNTKILGDHYGITLCIIILHNQKNQVVKKTKKDSKIVRKNQRGGNEIVLENGGSFICLLTTFI